MFYHSGLLQKHGINALFTNREGVATDFSYPDTQQLAHHIQALCQQADFPMPHQAIQVHQAEILYCSGAGYAHQQEADILLTTEKDVALAVRTADCVPILLADRQAGVIAAVHAGWRGTVAQVALKAVRVMCEHGANMASIVASLGPCIGPCCFQVREDVAHMLDGACEQQVSFNRGYQCFANLSLANQTQLLRAGILPEHIETSSHCTACHINPSYYSFRRDKGNTGRQLAMIMRTQVAHRAYPF